MSTQAICQNSCCNPISDISLKKSCQPIPAALATILLIGALFLILSAHQVVPQGINAISALGALGFLPGYFSLLLGLCVIGYSILRACKAPFPKSNSEPISTDNMDWQSQIKKAAQEDPELGSTSWKRGPGADEHEQTMASFIECEGMLKNAHKDTLKIVIVDSKVTPKEIEIVNIVCRYIEALHGITVSLLEEDLLSEIGRRNAQYAIESTLAKLTSNLADDSFVLGFTSQDLYPLECPQINFVFGAGNWRKAAGLFSTQRFRSKNFKKNLVRLLRLASHEFGHMRGMEHCTKSKCCMQGANHLGEADLTPLTFCAEDMAKICYLNRWSLKEGYQRHLDFFETFEGNFGIKIDFSDEITHLRKKIRSLV